MAPKYSQIIKKLGKNQIRQKEPLAVHTTFGIGGRADLYYEAKTTEELVKAVKLARELKTPHFILGGGSNILVSDNGFRGLIIKVQSSKFKVQKEKIIADAGVLLANLIEAARESSLSELEFAVGIPGTIGGAIVGNAGTTREWIGTLVAEVEVLTGKNEVKKLTQADCLFDYRTSRFKKTKEIILQVVLELKGGESEKIKQREEKFLAKRKDQPKEKSAGSIFKNPPEKPAGWLVDQCGLKGKKIGNAQISPKHTNYIVNLGKATADDVVQLIKLAKKEVQKKFGIELKEEICLLGFDKI